MEEEVNQEQKIYNQLHEMRDEYISEEVKKGNNEAVKKVKNVDMLPPPSKNQVQSLIEKKRDRSSSITKSPPKHESRLNLDMTNSPSNQQNHEVYNGNSYHHPQTYHQFNDQLDRLNRLQEEINFKYKISQVENTRLDQSLIF